MPVFFWTCAAWKGPLSLGMRLFRNADNETLALPPTASTADLAGLDDDDAATAPGDASRWLLARALPAEGPMHKGSTSTSTSSTCRRRTCLSPHALHGVLAHHSPQEPVPLACAAAHPLLRLIGEYACGLHFPGASTRLVSGAGGGEEGGGHVREVHGAVLGPLAGYVSVARWWWSRPQPQPQQLSDSALPVVAPLHVRLGRRSPGAATGSVPPLPPALARVVEEGAAAFQRAVRELTAATAGLCVVAAVRFDHYPLTPASLQVALDPCTCQHVHRVSLQHCDYVQDVSVLGLLPCLAELDVSYSGVATLTGLALSRTLRSFCARGCRQLADLSPLGQVPTLTDIVASKSGVQDIAGLADSRSLVSLSFYGCPALRDLSPLGRIPSLLELYASESGVDCIEGLRHSRSLERIGLRYCEVASLAALAAVPTLRVLNASCTPCASVEALRRCAALEQVEVSRCPQLLELAALGECPALRELEAGGTPVTSVAGLAQAPRLQRLVLSDCGELRDLQGLGQCAALEALVLSTSGVRSIDGLRGCVSLRSLDLGYCKLLGAGALRVLRDLPRLQEVVLRGCPVASADKATVEELRAAGVHVHTG